MAPDLGEPLATREIETRLLAFVQGDLLAGEASVDRDDDLLSGELLDSVAVLRLATWVGQEFDFEIQPADFVIENFQTVAVLAAYVRRATGEAG